VSSDVTCTVTVSAPRNDEHSSLSARDEFTMRNGAGAQKEFGAGCGWVHPVGSPVRGDKQHTRGQFEQLIKMYAGQAQLSPAHMTTMACNGMGGPTIDIMDRPYLDIQTCH